MYLSLQMECRENQAKKLTWQRSVVELGCRHYKICLEYKKCTVTVVDATTWYITARFNTCRVIPDTPPAPPPSSHWRALAVTAGLQPLPHSLAPCVAFTLLLLFLPSFFSFFLFFSPKKGALLLCLYDDDVFHPSKLFVQNLLIIQPETRFSSPATI